MMSFEHSWVTVLKEFRNQRGLPSLEPLCVIVEMIQEHRLDSRLYARSSHLMLSISLSERYDAKSDILRLSVVGSDVKVESFIFDKLKNSHELDIVEEATTVESAFDHVRSFF